MTEPASPADQSTESQPEHADSLCAGGHVTVLGGDHDGEPGVIVEAFGPLPDVHVDLGEDLRIRPRRYAVNLDNGMFVLLSPADLRPH